MINKITITGADDQINPQDLLALSQKYPLVEWAILISEARQGSPRYPSLSWIQELIAIKGPMNLSLHVCGKLCKDVLQGQEPELLFTEVNARPLISYFDRVQLNFNIQNYEMDLVKFMSLLGKLDNNIIFQANSANQELINFLIRFGNEQWHYLYDSSGGRGVSSGHWLPPFAQLNPFGKKDVYTGYAGGLSPENLPIEMAKILQVSLGSEIWLDVESGVRTNDQFDLQKVQSFLDIVMEDVAYSKWING